MTKATPAGGWYLRWADGVEHERVEAMAEGGAIEPGWYPDPHGSGRARYWSGWEWTDRTRSLPSDESATRSRPPWPVLVVGVLAAAATGALAILLLGSDSGADQDEAPIPIAQASTSDEPAATTTTAAESAAPTTTVAPASADPVDQWIAVLSSVEQSVSAAEADQRHAAITSQFPDARRLDSGQYASLRPGFWVSYVGPFADGDAAVAFCRGNGLAVPSSCYGRFLSHDPADEDLIADS